jgi:rSAM/selenodomain-associated transferase 1
VRDDDGENELSNEYFDYTKLSPSKINGPHVSILQVKFNDGSKTLNQLGLFAKFWQPGTVKTRLAASIGNLAAGQVYQTFLFHLLKRHGNSADSRWVVFSPPERESEFRDSISGAWDFVPQSSGDLGQRMQSFFQQQFERMNGERIPDSEASKVVVIGADCPQLSPAALQSAFAALDDNRVVIGPSTDGGYYLIGIRDQCLPIFSEIAWGTSSVLHQTRKQLDEQQIKYELLSPLTDVDQVEDLLELVADLERRKTLGQLDSLDLQLYENIQNSTGVRLMVEPE